jgi:alpha-amylase
LTVSDFRIRADSDSIDHLCHVQTGAAGFRLDSIKHMDEQFISGFVRAVRAAKLADYSNLFVLGEYWNGNVNILTAYLDRLNIAPFTLFDVPLHYNFKRASDAGESYDLRNILAGSLVQARAGNAVTFVDNHDTQPGQSLESWIGPTFKPHAYALILFRFVFDIFKLELKLTLCRC